MDLNLQTTLEACTIIRNHMGCLYWRDGRDNPRFNSRELCDKDLIGKNKTTAPLLHTVQTRKGYVVPRCVIWLDFDVLPPHFASWDAFREHLLELNIGLVFASASGKAKVACLADTGFKPFKGSASYSKNAAIAICPADLREWLDVSTATQLCFVTDKMFCLNVYADHPVHKLNILVDAYAEELRKGRPISTLVREFTGDLPADLSEEITKNVKLVKLLKMLLCFSKEEFDLPQKVLAETLGCGIATVNRMLALLKRSNILIVTNDSYMVGKQAMKYRFNAECSLGQLHLSLINTTDAEQAATTELRPQNLDALKAVAPLAQGTRFANTPKWFNFLRSMGLTSLEEMAEIMASHSEVSTPVADYLANLRNLAKNSKFGRKIAA